MKPDKKPIIKTNENINIKKCKTNKKIKYKKRKIKKYVYYF